MLAKILLGVGMKPSPAYTMAAEHNPEGLYEDIEIQAVHKEIIQAAGGHPYLPMPDGFLDLPGMEVFQRRLIDLVDARVVSDEIWGFKDPRTAGLIPLWTRVFNRAKVVPKYVLAIRNPAAAVASMHRQYNDPHEVAELVWLWRTCESIYQTGGNCFIVNYERWFEPGADEFLQQLREFTGLKGNEEFQLSGVLRENLNRSSYDDYVVVNEHVRQLYSVLSECHGVSFDRDRLMQAVSSCRKAIKGFSGWAMAARNHWARSEKLKADRAALNKPATNMASPEIKRDLELLSETLIGLKDLQAENFNLRNALKQKNLSADEAVKSRHKELAELKEALVSEGRLKLEKNTQRMRRLDEEVSLLRIRLKKEAALSKQRLGRLSKVERSTSYRLGSIIVRAFARPGINTLRLPFDLCLLVFKKN
ncbi:hypothetical protein HNE05_19530 [Aquipseudomonas campi]|uniref:Sulfotransferase family protein n=1 Tax=Aquipseudomonas campi TaxID=2731681 RepID=A0A6M8FN99_9GAMM|nr:hypothetical protein [Pseudomonas campi]QKE65460.1 hypothetical protein HNE05_19530 [Pseudomonas campi]